MCESFDFKLNRLFNSSQHYNFIFIEIIQNIQNENYIQLRNETHKL